MHELLALLKLLDPAPTWCILLGAAFASAFALVRLADRVSALAVRLVSRTQRIVRIVSPALPAVSACLHQSRAWMGRQVIRIDLAARRQWIARREHVLVTMLQFLPCALITWSLIVVVMSLACALLTCALRNQMLMMIFVGGITVWAIAYVRYLWWIRKAQIQTMRLKLAGTMWRLLV